MRQKVNASVTLSSPQCLGCGTKSNPGGALSVLHIDGPATTARKLVTMPKYVKGTLHDAVTLPSPSTVNTLQINQHTLSNIHNIASTHPAPLIEVGFPFLWLIFANPVTNGYKRANYDIKHC